MLLFITVPTGMLRVCAALYQYRLEFVYNCMIIRLTYHITIWATFRVYNGGYVTPLVVAKAKANGFVLESKLSQDLCLSFF